MYGLTLSVWTILVLGDLGWHLFRAFSMLPTDEVYANGGGFQFLAFVLTRFPYWAVGILMILLVEFFIVRRRSRNLVRQDSPSP